MIYLAFYFYLESMYSSLGVLELVNNIVILDQNAVSFDQHLKIQDFLNTSKKAEQNDAC